MTRVLLHADPYGGDASCAAASGQWPCAWVCCPDAGPPPFVTAFRLRFLAERAETVRVHVTADERYELFLDGERVGRGPERGDAENWFFETYDLMLGAGEHVLVARVWSLGEKAPYAQMSVAAGFLLSAQQERWQPVLSTGRAAWDTKRLDGYTFTNPLSAWGTGDNLVIDGRRFPWGVEAGAGEGWQRASVRPRSAGTSDANDVAPMHRLRPAVLPPMRDEVWTQGRVRLVSALATERTNAVPIRAADNLADEQGDWQSLLTGQGSITVPPRARRRILLDLQDYVCAYPALHTSGGAGSRVRIHWQEASYETAAYEKANGERKGHRDAVNDKYFRTVWSAQDGCGDVFLPDGGDNRCFGTLWWQCGRFVEIVVETGDAPLTVDALRFHETRYPLEREGTFAAEDARLEGVNVIALRTLQMCAHETFMDCPFYEQLQYVGDTRLQAVTAYTLTPDDRLTRKALQMFDASRLPSGLTQSRYPSRVRQTTRPFSLLWVSMVHDFARWRNDPAFVQSLMPGVRGVLNGFSPFAGPDGLIALPPGPNLNFVDWVPGWEHGTPPGGPVNAIVNWQWAMTLRQAAELEAWLGEPELSARAERLAREHAARTHAAFWDDGRGLYADDLEHCFYSEHAQCMAVLCGLLPPAQARRVGVGLRTAEGMAQATVYFMHYLFEAFHALGGGDALFDRLPLWFEMVNRGLKTTVEMPEPTRSDCHAWSAHPLFHASATMLGIRPAAFGFAHVDIAPALGPLPWAEGTMPHPHGEIAVRLRRDAGVLHACVTLPPGVPGTLRYEGVEQALSPGTQSVVVPVRK